MWVYKSPLLLKEGKAGPPKTLHYYIYYRQGWLILYLPFIFLFQ